MAPGIARQGSDMPRQGPSILDVIMGIHNNFKEKYIVWLCQSTLRRVIIFRTIIKKITNDPQPKPSFQKEDKQGP